SAADGPSAGRSILDAIQAFLSVGDADGRPVYQGARNGFALLELDSHVDECIRSPEAVVGLNVRRVATSIGILRDVGPDRATFIVILEDDVYHPGDSIRSVQRSGTICEDFHMVDGGGGYEGKIRGSRTAACPNVGGNVTAFAIDQNKGVVWRKRTHAGRECLTCHVGAALLCIVGGNLVGDGVHEVRCPTFHQHVIGDHLDWCRAVGYRHSTAPGASDENL